MCDDSKNKSLLYRQEISYLAENQSISLFFPVRKSLDKLL